MEQRLRAAVAQVITAAMDAVVDKVLHQDPFDIEKRRREVPLHTALVPEDIFKGSHFERRFVTPFGTVWEKLAAAIGKDKFGFAETQHMVVGHVRQGCLDRIQRTLDRLEHGRVDGERIQPDWAAELRHAQGGDGPLQEVSVNCDVYVSSTPDAAGIAFELKAPKPNSDQTKVSKEKLLKLRCMRPPQVRDAYYALPYNPFGTRDDYDWPFAARWFNMQHDSCVLIGDELWTLLGDEGTYQAIVEVALEVGRRYSRTIYEDYLGLSVPPRQG